MAASAVVAFCIVEEATPTLFVVLVTIGVWFTTQWRGTFVLLLIALGAGHLAKAPAEKQHHTMRWVQWLVVVLLGVVFVFRRRQYEDIVAFRDHEVEIRTKVSEIDPALLHRVDAWLDRHDGPYIMRMLEEDRQIDEGVADLHIM